MLQLLFSFLERMFRSLDMSLVLTAMDEPLTAKWADTYPEITLSILYHLVVLKVLQGSHFELESFWNFSSVTAIKLEESLGDRKHAVVITLWSLSILSDKNATQKRIWDIIWGKKIKWANTPPPRWMCSWHLCYSSSFTYKSDTDPLCNLTAHLLYFHATSFIFID